MITHTRKLLVFRATTYLDRADALKVLKSTYRDEKQWVQDEASIFPEEDLVNPHVSWFVAYVGTKPAGVLRVLYDPQLGGYGAYGLQMVQAVDIEAFLRTNRVAEIGRLAVHPRFRRVISIVTLLFKAAAEDTVRQGFTHYITDIFENEPHNPFNFHTRVLGFQTVATHDHGEMNCPNRRITMLLNLRDAYRNLQFKRSKLYRFLTEGWDETLHRHMMAGEA